MIGQYQRYAEKCSKILLELSKEDRIDEAAKLLNKSIILMKLSDVGGYVLALHNRGMRQEARKLVVLWAIYIRKGHGSLALYWRIRNLEDRAILH